VAAAVAAAVAAVVAAAAAVAAAVAVAVAASVWDDRGWAWGVVLRERDCGGRGVSVVFRYVPVSRRGCVRRVVSHQIVEENPRGCG